MSLLSLRLFLHFVLPIAASQEEFSAGVAIQHSLCSLLVTHGYMPARNFSVG
jgi:hypothetical protein